jgi:CheY-like chemotaxis protein
VPGMDGLELCDAMRRERPELKVLVRSGRASDATLAAERHVPFLLKPLDPAVLRQKFAEILT